MNLWALAAMLTPGAMALTGDGWNWIGLGGLGAAGVLWALLYLEKRAGCPWVRAAGKRKPGKLLLAVELVWTAAAIARALQLTNGVFVDGPDDRIVALAVLLLAMEAGKEGCEAPLRVMGVVGQVLASLMAAFLLTSLHTLRWQWCIPEGRGAETASAFGILLVPAVLMTLPAEPGERLSCWMPVITALTAAAMAAVTAGIVSPQVASAVKNPMYLAAKSMSVGTVMERMEPLLSVILLMGAFATVLLLLCSAREMLRGLEKNEKNQGAFFALCAVSYGAYFGMDLVPEWILILGASIFWGLIPALTLWVEGQKKFQKREK